MGEASSTFGGKEKCIMGFGGEALKKETTRNTQA
jgi:hypothetical protein